MNGQKGNLIHDWISKGITVLEIQMPDTGLDEAFILARGLLKNPNEWVFWKYSYNTPDRLSVLFFGNPDKFYDTKIKDDLILGFDKLKERLDIGVDKRWHRWE